MMISNKDLCKSIQTKIQIKKVNNKIHTQGIAEELRIIR